MTLTNTQYRLNIERLAEFIHLLTWMMCCLLAASQTSIRSSTPTPETIVDPKTGFKIMRPELPRWQKLDYNQHISGMSTMMFTRPACVSKAPCTWMYSEDSSHRLGWLLFSIDVNNALNILPSMCEGARRVKHPHSSLAVSLGSRRAEYNSIPVKSRTYKAGINPVKQIISS